jgi:formate-dependent nitrite reductase membrane component NrfD
MILLTIIDRFMSTTTQVRYRSFSQLKVAYRMAPMIGIISMILSSHVLVFFDFYPSCIAKPGIYSIFYSIYLILWTGVLPNGFIILFSFLTVRNAIRTKRRVAPIAITQQQRRVKRTESQLLIVR